MENYEKIKDDFKKVITYSQEISNPNINELFDKWAMSKSYFINAFNNQLIYEYPQEVSFDLGSHEKELRVEEFVHTIESYWRNYKLAEFVADNKAGFFDNRVVYPIELKDGTKIPKGMKLVRAFKYFETNKDVLYQIQNRASMLIQEDKISGKLCLSIHPLDYLSSSENAYNWRSCHSLDGDYRSGNLSYMVDNSTIICYLKSENNEILPNFPTTVPWTNKKWRMLIHFSEDKDMMFAGRQYPFTSATALDFIKDNILPETKLPLYWSNWSNYKITTVSSFNEEVHLHVPYVPVGGYLKAMNDLVIEGENAMNFNDILHSSCYDPLYSCALGSCGGHTRRTNKYTKFIIGGSVKCLECGKQSITTSETMRCIECETKNGTTNSDNFGYCACCGRHVYLDDVTWVHDEPLCQYCLDNEIEECDDCGELYYRDELIYNRADGGSYCRYCYNRHSHEIDEEEW